MAVVEDAGAIAAVVVVTDMIGALLVASFAVAGVDGSSSSIATPIRIDEQAASPIAAGVGTAIGASVGTVLGAGLGFVISLQDFVCVTACNTSAPVPEGLLYTEMIAAYSASTIAGATAGAAVTALIVDENVKADAIGGLAGGAVAAAVGVGGIAIGTQIPNVQYARGAPAPGVLVGGAIVIAGVAASGVVGQLVADAAR